MFVRIAILTIVIAGAAAATGAVAMNNKAAEKVPFPVPPGPELGQEMSGFSRVLITPKSADGEADVRGRSYVAIRHEFNGKFSANVPNEAIPALEEVAIIEEVPIWQVHECETCAKAAAAKTSAKPMCGDGTAHSSEQCGEPGLSECAAGETCQNCKCVAASVEPPPGDRLCYPANQRDYNVVQVNGGQPSDGAGVNVAVLDTGVLKSHPDLDVKMCKDATKRGIIGGCDDKSSNAHGTHTAGIVAANGGSDGLGLFGVAPGANLWVIKVCGNSSCYTDDIAAAINYAAAQGANIINMSFGSGAESFLVRQAIAANPNVLFIASAGNSGPNPNTIEYPAANPAVVAVAAHNSNKIVASFSSRGIDDGDDSSIAAREVELSAGGVSVESANSDGCYSSMSGTSFSSPTVAGLAAKVWQGTASATRAYMLGITEDIVLSNGGGTGIGFDIASGYGMPIAP